MKVKIISIPNNINAAKWHACGGKLYPDGGPIDPPWASFVPSQPREPQVVKPQPQVNPYLLGLSAGTGQNEAAKYSTAAQTPEFQQGYYDGQAQVAASEAVKAGRAPIVEPGIEMVSPGLDLSPVGDVRSLIDAGEYYQATGDLKTALGLAALGVVAVPGAGKAAERAGREFLDDVTLKEVKHFPQFIESSPTLSPSSEKIAKKTFKERFNDFLEDLGDFDSNSKTKTKPESSTISTSNTSEAIPTPEATPKKQREKFGKWLSKPWKERGKFRKSFDIVAPLSVGIGGGAYVYDRVSTNNRNFTPPVDEQEWMEKDSVTLRNEALKNKSDSLEQVRMKQRYDYLISQGYSPEQALAVLYGGAQYE